MEKLHNKNIIGWISTMAVIVTKKLYEQMSLSEYNKAKQEHIKRTLPRYEKKFIEHRWDMVINQFKTLAPAYQAELSTFQNARKNTNYNLFNLSLPSCLKYFEDFYFLYTTEDPRFKLNAFNKNRLLEAINDAMTTCETGISTRFELVLQLYRTDLNWVTNLLSKHRYQLLLGIQDAYNEKYSTPDSMRVHVLKRMIKLARENELGVNIEHRIKDAFAGYTNKKEIIQYFQKQYPLVFFDEYENAIVDILSQHILYEINELYCPAAQHATWETAEVTLLADQVGEFTDYLINRLALGGRDIRNKLGVLDEDTYEFTLKKKADCLAALRDMVKQKLLQERYYVAFSQLIKRNQALLKQIRFKKGVDVSALVDLNESIMDDNWKNPQPLAQILMKGTTLLLHYPEMLLSHTKRHQNVLSFLPKEIRTNAHFLEQAIPTLTELLLAAIADDHPILIHKLMSHLIYLAKENSHCLEQLPPPIISHPAVALKMVQLDGLLYKNLPMNLQLKEHILMAALQQNPLALLYAPPQMRENAQYVRLALANKRLAIDGQTNFEFAGFLGAIGYTYARLYNSLPMPFKSEIQLIDPISLFSEGQSAKIIQSLEKIEALTQLVKAARLSLSDMTRLTKMITPEQIIKVIKYRQRMNLPPLPYCKNAAVVEHFIQALKEDDVSHWEDGYEAVKKQACKLTHLYLGQDGRYEKNAVRFVAKTDSWYLGMLQYQRSISGSYKNKKQLWNQLKQASKAAALLLWALTKIAVIAVGGVFLAILANYFLANFLPPLVFLLIGLLALVAPIFAARTNNRMAMGIATIFSMAGVLFLYLDVWLLLGASFLCVLEIMKLPQLFKEFASSWTTLFSRLFQSMSPNFEHTNAMGPHADLKAKCEGSIARLKLMDNPAAQEKAELLEMVWNTINKDMERRELHPKQAEAELARRLHEPQMILYQGKEYRLSFYQLASVPRSPDKQLTLPSSTSSSKYGFFKTSSIKLLPTERELATLSCVA